MKPKNNPYSSLKRPGIRGAVQTEKLNVYSILVRQECSITVYTGELLPGVWDYGLHIVGHEVSERYKLPGEGEGWFRSETDALLYALGDARKDFEIGSEQSETLRHAIIKASKTTLF